jgi:hypothetical protein
MSVQLSQVTGDAMNYQIGKKPYEWPGGAPLALSVVLNVEEGAEANILDGDKYPEPVDEMGLALKRSIRNHGNESNYRYGLTRGGPRVMRLFEQYGIRATITACAPATWAARACATATPTCALEAPTMTGTRPATSSITIAVSVRRSSLLSCATSLATPG